MTTQGLRLGLSLEFGENLWYSQYGCLPSSHVSSGLRSGNASPRYAELLQSNLPRHLRHPSRTADRHLRLEAVVPR